MNYELKIKNKTKHLTPVAERSLERETAQKTKRFSKGFSLVETLVATAIMVLAIIGPMTAAERSLISARYSKDQMIAYFLAEEGLEYIHYLRDMNAIKNPNHQNKWLQDISENCLSVGGSSKACGVDPTAFSQNVFVCNAGNKECLLYFNSGTGIYSHDNKSGVASVFRRRVTLTNSPSGNPNEKKLDVDVSWVISYGNQTKTVTLTEYITNWKEQVVY